MQKFQRHECQMCGAPIGYVGRAFQWALGCKLVNRCGGTDLQKILMNLPTRGAWVFYMSVAFVGLVIFIKA